MIQRRDRDRQRDDRKPRVCGDDPADTTTTDAEAK